MSVTYFVALPFVRTEEGIAPAQAQEMPNEVSRPLGTLLVRPFTLMRHEPGGAKPAPSLVRTLPLTVL